MARFNIPFKSKNPLTEQEKADKAIDAVGDKFTDVLKKGIAFVKRNVIEKIKVFLQTFKTASKQSVNAQKKVVEEAKITYYKAKDKANKKKALLKLAHEIGKLNGYQQMVAIKTTLKKVLNILKGVGHAVLPDMMILGANYGSTLSHTAGIEQVYDFRTREIGTFVFGGVNIGTNQINALIGKSIGANAGVYLALGWQHSLWCKTLEDKYSGLFKTVDFSVEVPGLSIPSFAGISLGGVAAVSAKGYGGTLGKCCPLFDDVKTVGFSVSASISLGKSPIPFSGGFGCTDYSLKNIDTVCEDSLLGFITEVTKRNILLPTNLLLGVGLALANDFRSSPSVCGRNFVSPNTCPCQGLPAAIQCCGNRACKQCGNDEYDRAVRTKKQREIKDALKSGRKSVFRKTNELLRNNVHGALNFARKNWKDIVGHKDSDSLLIHKGCDKRSKLFIGKKGKSVKALQLLLDLSADGLFGRNTKVAVKKFQVENGLVDDGIVGDATWEKLCPVNDREEGTREQD